MDTGDGGGHADADGHGGGPAGGELHRHGLVDDAASVAASASWQTGQQATVATALAVGPGVLVTDTHGNPVPNVEVTFAGDGSVADATVQTDGAGLAGTTWTLGTAAGTQTLTGTVSGLTAVTFTATGLAASASAVSASASWQTGEQATVATALVVGPEVLVTDTHGNPVPNVEVTFAGDGSVADATVQTDATGLAGTTWTLGTAAGTQTLTGTVSGLTAVSFTATGLPPPNAVADPTLLPAATGQVKDAGFDYGRSLQAGESYADSITGAVVFKVTDANTPVAGTAHARVNYAAGGPYISLPWGSNEEWYTIYFLTRHTLAPFTRAWFVDFNMQTGTFANYRLAPTSLQGGDGENALAFSYNPATPRIAYVCPKWLIERVDTETATMANTGFFPKDLLSEGLTRGSMIHVDENDRWISCEQFQKQKKFYWNSETDVLHTYDQNLGDAQNRLDRSGSYGFIQFNGPSAVQIKTMDLSDGSVSEPLVFEVSHPGAPRGYLVGSDPTTAGGVQLFQYNPVTEQQTLLGGPGEIINNSGHHSDQWVLGNTTGIDQWVLFSGWGIGKGSAVENAIVFHRLNAANIDTRLLVHHDSDVGSGRYYEQPHANIGPNGRLVTFESDMNTVGGRVDLFLVIVPAR